MLCPFAFWETPWVNKYQQSLRRKKSHCGGKGQQRQQDNHSLLIYPMGQHYWNQNVLPEDCFLDLRTARSCCRTKSQELCTCTRQVHMLLMEDTGVTLAESCSSRGGCQDTWRLRKSDSYLKLNYCLTRSGQMWPWNGNVMTDSKNHPLINSFPITSCRFCFPSRGTDHNLTPTHFLCSLTTLCSLPIDEALLICLPQSPLAK